MLHCVYQIVANFACILFGAEQVVKKRKEISIMAALKVMHCFCFFVSLRDLISPVCNIRPYIYLQL